jgi:HemY protein
MHPNAEESRLTQAELHIAAEDFPAARRALGDLFETNPTQRSLTIMAAVERGEGADDAVVRGWLARALTAKRGPQWVCTNCQHVEPTWQAVCDNCGAFDTLEWRDTPEGAGPSATQTELLPLIVGTLPKPDATSDARFGAWVGHWPGIRFGRTD